MVRVPGIIAAFWMAKGLSTALGEGASDYLVQAMAPQLAVVLGFIAFLVALVVQFRQARYRAWTYWFAVAMVGIFGTMAADVMHVALGVPYSVSSALYAVLLLAVFWLWRRTEGTLSIHTIDSPRREAFYWATVVATFAMGTALGDFTAFTLHLGYFASAAMFAALILIPAVGYRWLSWNPVFCFWAAYVITRPLGASIADGLGKSRSAGGLGFGDGPVALVLLALIVLIVAYLSVTRADVQRAPDAAAEPESAAVR
ncbi:hypothetical protein ACIQ6V_31825 [Streptomyces sp. NPDC096198]|uniref:COG4705 family protein n=1 Tax=Streptomyces sp. NPDC096198 TaxID=3366080 RepID=UPI003819F1A6